MRITRIALVAACVVLGGVAAVPAHANPPSWSTVLTCSSVSGTTATPYTPYISTSGPTFSTSGNLTCQRFQTGVVTNGLPPTFVTGPATFVAGGTFLKAANGYGVATGGLTIFFHGTAYYTNIVATFAGGVGPFAGTAIDGDGANIGAISGTFVEPQCPPPPVVNGCSIAAAGELAFTLTVDQAPPRP
jgi:hypothetical protein